MLCFTDYSPSEGDLAGQEKIKVYYEMICIAKINMIAKIQLIAKFIAS